MKTECGPKDQYAISICPGGHATLHLGRTALFLEIDELRTLLEAGREAMDEYEKRVRRQNHDSLLESFRSPVSH